MKIEIIVADATPAVRRACEVLLINAAMGGDLTDDEIAVLRDGVADALASRAQMVIDIGLLSDPT